MVVVGAGAAVVAVGGTVVVVADVLVLATAAAVERFVWWVVEVAATFAGADDLPAKYAPMATPARTTTARAT